MISRRQLIKTAGAVSLAAFMPGIALGKTSDKKQDTFRYCLNTSTIKGQKPGLIKSIEIASKAGYDAIELWVSEIKDYLKEGHSIAELKKIIDRNGLTVENAIGFGTWLVDDDQKRKEGFAQMKEEMLLVSKLGCKRIAAPPTGVKANSSLDLFVAAERFKQLIELGRETGVLPQLEFWGGSGTLFQLGQSLMIALNTNDPDAHILADIYHLFRGNSGFEGLKMLRGNLIEIFHMNDYITSISREKQNDQDRVYPGDGAAPTIQILTDLKGMGGTKVLSLELFNPKYWKEDPLSVAITGLAKMKNLVSQI
jgi:sugar phosphate isomerase/epimerase